jgi:ribosomal protein L11 methyltransferase
MIYSMNYIEITFRISELPEYTRELLPYWLESLGFEGFQDSQNEMIAYIPENLFNRDTLVQVLAENHIPVNCFAEALVPEKNWNEEWESNFEPVVIADRCLIRAPFHNISKPYPYEIVIEPKMSFGTGHHATTSLMIMDMLDADFKGKRVLDAGCGTGILAILAEKLGAEHITAVDIDEWSYRNSLENAGINHCNNINLIQGDAASVSGQQFDIILANINLNILKAGIQKYSAMLKPGGIILMSGILVSDIETLREETEKFDFIFRYSKTFDNWAFVKFSRK